MQLTSQQIHDNVVDSESLHSDQISLLLSAHGLGDFLKNSSLVQAKTQRWLVTGVQYVALLHWTL